VPEPIHASSACQVKPTSKLVELVTVRRRAARRARNYCRDLLCRIWSSVWLHTEHQPSTIQRADGDNQRQLESSPTTFAGTVLPDGQDVFGRGRRGVRNESEKTNVGRPRESIKSSTDESRLTMQTALLKPDTHLRIRYPVPRKGWIEYTVEADGVPVTTWVLDEKGLKEFNSGKEDVSSYYGGFAQRYKHHQELKLPFSGWWYLIIENNSHDDPAAVHYEVSG
jgi:hypothetical protein